MDILKERGSEIPPPHPFGAFRKHLELIQDGVPEISSTIIFKRGLKRVGISHQCGLSSGWSLTRLVFNKGGLSEWFLTRVLSHQAGLSLGRSLTRLVSHQGGLLSE